MAEPSRRGAKVSALSRENRYESAIGPIPSTVRAHGICVEQFRPSDGT